MRARVRPASSRLGFRGTAGTLEGHSPSIVRSGGRRRRSYSGALHSRNGNTSRLCILAFLSHAAAAAGQGRRPTHNYQTLEGAPDGHRARIRPVSPPWAPPVPPCTDPYPLSLTPAPRRVIHTHEYISGRGRRRRNERIRDRGKEREEERERERN